MYKTGFFLSHVGEMERAFDKTLEFQTVYRQEENSNKRYFQMLNGGNFVHGVDLKDIVPSKLPSLDVLVASLPYQNLSFDSDQEDVPESQSLVVTLLNIIDQVKPKIVVLEMANNIYNESNQGTFGLVNLRLLSAGYRVKFSMLNGLDITTIPQNKRRFYIVGFRGLMAFDRFEFPVGRDDLQPLGNFIDYDRKVSDKYYYVPGRYQDGFYELLDEGIDHTEALWQWRRSYLRMNKPGICPTLGRNMGQGGHNVPLLRDRFGIRKLTPRECFRFQGFSDGFIFPENASDSYLYRVAGASSSVPMIERLASSIADCLMI